MRVLAAADLHGYLPTIEPCDVLVLAGDICPDFFKGHWLDSQRCAACQKNWIETHLTPWLQEAPAGEVVAIAGNHDFVFERYGADYARGLPWTYLQDEGVTIDGVHFWGTPWVPTLASWAFFGSESFLEERAAAIPESVDVLISHGPPYGVADRVGRQRVGDFSLRGALRRVNPRVVICGHIHEGSGWYVHANCELGIINAAIMDEFYSPRNGVRELIL